MKKQATGSGKAFFSKLGTSCNIQAKACKKAGFAPTGAVCRSCTTMPVSTGASPPGGKGGTPFPALVPGAGTLPVGFQGRSALVAPRGAKSRILTEGSCALSTTTPIPWSTAARCHRDTGPPIRGRDGRFRRRAAQTAPCDCSGRSRS